MVDQEIPFEILENYLRKPSESRRSSESLEMSDNMINKIIQRSIIQEDLARPFFKTQQDFLENKDSIDFN
jgi:hypothetical protein